MATSSRSKADDKPEAKADDKPEAKDESRSSGTRYLNTTSGPVVFDKDGHSVDAAGWTPEITLDTVGRAARKAGHLKPESEL